MNTPADPPPLSRDLSGDLLAIPANQIPGPARHWLTRWDPADGKPYGQICLCGIGADHDGNGDLMPG